MKNTLLKKLSLLITTTALGAALVSCSASTGDSNNSGSDSGSTDLGTEPLSLEAGWAKASDSMTGVFGTLHNATTESVALVGASSSVASIVEMHETVVSSGNMQMQEIDGGFDIPAGGTYELSPGGDHIMLMGLERELLPGEQLDLTLVFSDGTELDMMIDIRDYAGAIEEYAPGDHDDHAEHDEHADN